MAVIENKVNHISGIALGGIGTGTVELLPDGEFHYWQIANATRWSAVNGSDDGECSVGCLSFYIRAEYPDGSVQFRKLGQMTDNKDFTYSMFSWNRPMEKIIFEGRFPCAKLTYKDKNFPIAVSMKATAPFVPHNEKLSGTPGFVLDFQINNPCNVPVKISLLGTLRPDFMFEKSTSNKLIKDGKKFTVFMQSEGKLCDANFGNIAFSLTSSSEKSYVAGDWNRYVQEYIGWTDCLGVTQESLLIEYREKGVLPTSCAGKRPCKIPDDLNSVSDNELSHLLQEYTKYSSNKVFLERINHTKPNYPSTRDEKIEFLSWLNRQKKGNEFGACALSSEQTLLSGESADIRFALSWYFPNHYRINTLKDNDDHCSFETDYNICFGHYYENLYKDALDVNNTLTCKYNEIIVPAMKFSELLYSTNLPEYWSDAWSVHLSTIIKDSWWLKNGKFGLWEGLGSCGFHTTDITYHASFGLTVLFPELQKRQMRMGSEFQREDGRVHHFFTPDLDHVDNGFERVDMNPQFVLMVCRDWLYTGDKQYVNDMWKHIVSAMDAINKLDADGDGLPDTGTTRNTYDSWNFSGASAYISCLWLASLRSAVTLAKVMKDNQRAEEWDSIRIKGLKSFEEKLWNGKYYNLWVDGDKVDACLMTDQLDGEWFLRSAGLEPNLSDIRIKKILSYIFKNNFDPEDGLINATCPEGMPTTVFTYKNCQAGAVWTGIGYAYAALCARVGLTMIADKEVKSIHESQLRLGRFWNHWECGYRYTRPLSSWTTLISLSGQKMNYSEKILYLNPCKNNLAVPVITTDWCALAEFTSNECRLTVTEGSADGWNIYLPDGMELTVN